MSFSDAFLERFGLRFSENEESQAEVTSIIEKNEPSTEVIDDISGSNNFALSMSFDENFADQSKRIEYYRDMARNSYVADALKEIVNDAIVTPVDSNIVSLNLDNVKISDSIKTKINEEFEYILNLLNFHSESYEIFESWYVDGIYPLYKIVNKEDPSKGIVSLRYLDPKYLKRVQEVQRDPKTKRVVSRETFFMYADEKLKQRPKGIKFNEDSIVYATSGIVNKNNEIESHLEKAIVPYNQLNNLEVAVLIYFISRAPERLVFYIDTNKMNNTKANQYVNKIANKYQNKTVYDVKDGTVKNNKDIKTILENYWLPRQEGSQGTEIQSLGGGQQLQDQLEIINHFQRKLYQALNVPLTRLEAQQNFQFGRQSEITRDELNFRKFIDRLLNKFSNLFLDLLRTQLHLKNILKYQEFDKLKNNILFDFETDSIFKETKFFEVMQQRMDILDRMREHVKEQGGYFSPQYVKRNVLGFDDQQIEQMNKETKEAAKEGFFKGDEDGPGF